LSGSIAVSPYHTAAVVTTNPDAIGEAIAALPNPVSFLSADAADHLVPVNSNGDWAAGFGKRTLDIVVALAALVLLSPLMALVALAIKCDSRGPVFFRQTRTGACGRLFDIVKFRSMHVLENGAVVEQAKAGDPRTTKLGAVLRRYSIDELPQLFNVLAGDMSLVGPRPHARAHDDFYGARIAEYATRFAVKPGLTGWAQINGLRGPTPTVGVMAARIARDTWYVKHASFALDLKILLKTPFAVVSSRNAY
jgi:exopolysaccharide biosynthesis polyprenyl glycosylphosphotransferase